LPECTIASKIKLLELIDQSGRYNRLFVDVVFQARVDRVSVDGLNRTKQDIVNHVVRDLFSVDNFEDMLAKVHAVRGKLANLGCFKNISILIDVSSGPGATAHGYEVTYQVNELKRVHGGLTTHVSNNEGLLTLTMGLPNMWGRGEELKGEYNCGSRKTKTFNLSLVKPFISKRDVVGTASLFQNVMEWPVSGYKLIDRGVLLDLAFASLPKVKHNLQWEGSWRELGIGNRYSSFEIRKDAGNTLKSALRHIVKYDARDSTIFPSCGTLASLSTEFAGLGGNVGFLKNEFAVQANLPLFSEDFVLQGSFNAGIMNPVDENKQPFVCDNFFLGGPLTLRGFDLRGVGPQADGNFIGAKVFWSGALHLYTPLPFRPGSGGFGDLFRSHLFINVGNIGDYELNNMVEEQKNSLRLAWGIGIAFRLGSMARIELNYCFPKMFADSDVLVSGIQMGVGLDFL
ncbi:hypothetical protein AAG570_002218, partial [Ranatra chinensis]